MQINTTAIKQLNAFTQFAADFGFKSKKVAQIDDAARIDGTFRNIKASASDKAYVFRREQSDKDANNAVRRLFKQTIIDLFGGENRIPEDVRKKMELGDYGKGKPLTARRIAMVKDAVIKVLVKNKDGIIDEKGNARLAGEIIGDMRGLEEAVKKPAKGRNAIEDENAIHDRMNVKAPAKQKPAYAIYNQKIADDIRGDGFNNLPRDIQRAFDDVIAEINDLCGEGTVTSKGKLKTFVGSAPLCTELDARAKVFKRNLKYDDMCTILRNIIRKTNAVEAHALSKFVNKKLSKAVVNSLLQNIPGLKDELRRCNSGAAINATLERYREPIEMRLRIAATIDRFEMGGAKELLIDEYAKATGLSREKLSEILPLREYSGGNSTLISEMKSGKSPAQSDEEIEQAFRDNAKEYLRVRQDIAREVDLFDDIPEKVRENIRLSALTATTIKGFSLSKCHDCATDLDIHPFQSAIEAKPFSVDNAVTAMRQLFKQIDDFGKARLIDGSGKNLWASYGADDIQQFAATVMKFALADKPELVEALKTHADEIRDGVGKTIARNETGYLAMNTGIYQTISEMAEALEV